MDLHDQLQERVDNDDNQWNEEKKRFVYFTRYSLIISIPTLVVVGFFIQDQPLVLAMLGIIAIIEIGIGVKSEELYDMMNSGE